jgi:hypothetical protein
MLINPDDFRTTAYSGGVYINCGKRNDHPHVSIDRNQFLINLVKDKRIIHLGCCDHLAVIEVKRKSNTWLHGLLISNSSVCIGIDNDEKAINYLTEHLKITDTYCCDITSTLPEQIRVNKYDFIIAGEILEHINNPVEFLKKMRTNLLGIVNQVVITVPNAFSYINFRNATKNFEANNPDHKYWFTPHTLAKVCFEAGLTPKEFYFINKFPKTGLIRHVYYLMKRFPVLRQNLVMICNIK